VPSLVYFLAIGRLIIDPRTGELQPDKHKLVAHNFTTQQQQQQQHSQYSLDTHPHLDPEFAAQIKTHLKAILRRAGHKLTPSKRIRLKDDGGQYEIHIITEMMDEDRSKTLVFFAVTAPDFPKYHSVPSLLKDLKAGFEQTVDSNVLWGGGSVQKACQPYFNRIMDHYGQSHLRSVEVKVESVRDVMANSVKRALSSVEHLEEMDEQAEIFEDKSKTFYKRGTSVKVEERSKYRKLTILLILAVVGILAYFIIPAIINYNKNHDDGGAVTPPDSSSSSSSSTGGYNSTGSTGT